MMQDQKIETGDACANLVWRRFSGPAADELFIQCRPESSENMEVAHQTASIYQALDALLQRENGLLTDVVHETVFFREIRKDFDQFQRARRNSFDPGNEGCPCLPASIYVEQPPIDSAAALALNAVAIIPRRRPAGDASVVSPSSARSFTLKEQKCLFLGSVYGVGGTAFEQALTMFRTADEALAREEMSFRNVVRTWIYLREIDRDYAEFNMARRAFFNEKNVDLLPASTGIRSSAFPDEADFALSLYAVKSPGGLQASAMTTPTLNEACTYGSDFSRGLRVVEDNKIALYVSGTASVDDRGFTVHVGDFEAQVHRMLRNLGTLLAAQNASFRDVLSAVTYLKMPGDAQMLCRILQDRGLSYVPNTVVHAPLCRSDLLCEMEAIAALQLPSSGMSQPQ